ncbi:hypothetical protein KUW09_06195 [Mameliella alba]|nr:hypothetical protein [Antarctobacter heliothermus]MBY6143624.1 hypothetical protein [Mameliella alba]MCA0952652.1 hypothetical protein [Mameliella alba]
MLHRLAPQVRAFAALLFCAAAPAGAAEFLEGGDADLGCILTIEGQIGPGDAEAFRGALDRIIGDPYRGDSDFLDRMDMRGGLAVPRICLNSPGGSLAEALKMTDVLTNRAGTSDYLYTSIGTAVPAQAICHSACAVLFMAGGTQSESEAGRLPNRVLHARGSLGFHAPGLFIADGNYSAETVGKAFSIAVQSIGELSDRQNALRFPASLLNRMVGTPPEDMYVLTTVGEATQWMIDIAGLPYPERPGLNHLVNVCLNAQPALRPSAGYRQSYVTPHDGDGRSFFDGRKLGNLAQSVAQYYGGGEARINLGGDEFGEAYFNSDPEEPVTGGLNCEVNFGGRWPLESPMRGNTRRFAVSAYQGGQMAVDQAALYPPWARFADMAARHGSRPIPARTILWDDNKTVATRCYVYNSNDRLTDDDPCTAVESVQLLGDGSFELVHQFTWPSGSRTTLTWQGYDVQINGNRAEGAYIEAASAEGVEIMCLRNSASGNAFCFQQVPFD